MPIDDLDQLLAMELGGAPEPRKTSKQVSSLEAQVLNRVREVKAADTETEESVTPSPTTSAATGEKLDASNSINSINPLNPLYQFIDTLIITAEKIAVYLDGAAEAPALAELQAMRTELAELLLALPDDAGFDKPGVFAAIATCLDAVNSSDAEARRVARVRLEKLMSGIAQAQSQAEQARSQAVADFLESLPPQPQ